MCQGKSKSRLIEKIRDHFIQFGWHLEFRVWKGPSPKDDSDEEWVANASNPNIIEKGVQAIEGVHMENMVDNMFQLEPMEDGLAQSWNPTTSSVNLASTCIIQNVFEIVDDL
jgi:hypothetical protein